ncbi:uncharacterized protein LOC126377111 isoform X2 [Pectinophora gossypiella]|uniref:uncharacterized protein LOC126377111 isoform X2 n=1 Tax=Pectinophora gossypiella TaxID=13191 RepID=UPI00214DFA66|nr:uncharacterized protein LOC126377111 isoform X2 [Pectinophora gossypiella]
MIIKAFLDPLFRIELPPQEMNETRRILRGRDVGDTRPYMVYMRPAPNPQNTEVTVDANWLCGGVIIDERYILTSAACIEDIKHFYVVSGMKSWVPASDTNNECIVNGAKKAVWKCVPKSYVFDGHDFDNIRWMANDIAVVKVEDDFNFNRRVRGCDFIPQKIAYNNQSADMEKAGSLASIAGWGSTDAFSDILAGDAIVRSAKNSETLLETEVVLLSKKNCKKRWPERYHRIIDDYMICGKDGMDTESMSKACSEQEVNCKELTYSDETEDDLRRSGMIIQPDDLQPLGGRRSKPISGGFCENDHGGPLVVGHGKTSTVIGVMSASLTREKTNQCYGPFLYTSVYNNRHLISCAIYKEMGAACRKLLRASRTQITETYFSWKAHPDGPSKDKFNDKGREQIVLRADDDDDDIFNATTFKIIPMNSTETKE